MARMKTSGSSSSPDKSNGSECKEKARLQAEDPKKNQGKVLRRRISAAYKKHKEELAAQAGGESGDEQKEEAAPSSEGFQESQAA
ncbi:hypothetical protein JCM10213_001435 [Rhodosporidiobolus nylandii]